MFMPLMVLIYRSAVVKPFRDRRRVRLRKKHPRTAFNGYAATEPRAVHPFWLTTHYADGVSGPVFGLIGAYRGVARHHRTALDS